MPYHRRMRLRPRRPEPEPRLPGDLWWASRVLVPLLLVLGLPPKLAELFGLIDLPGPWWLLSLVSPTALVWLTWRVRRVRGWRSARKAVRTCLRVSGAMTLVMAVGVLLWYGQ